MGFFGVNGPFYKFISRLFDILKLNFLWIIFSLPIITIGASTAAVFSVTLKMAEDEEGYIGRSFLKGFKDNIKQGIPLGLMSIAAVYIVYLNFALFHAIESNPLPLLVTGMLSAAYFLLSLLYAFPLAARYKNTLLKTINNSFRISMKYIGRTFVLLIVIAVLVLMFSYNSTMLFMGILFGPAFIIYTISEFTMRIFRKIEEDPESVIKENEKADKK